MKSHSAARFGLPSVTRPAILACVFIMTALAGSARAQTGALPSPWTRDWNAARQRAATVKIPLLAMFSAEWSPPCEEVLTRLLTVTALQEQLMAKWVPVYVDEAQYPDLHKRYQIRALPTFVVFNLNGEEHTRFVGSREPDNFLGKLQDAYETMVELAQIREALKKDPRNPFLYKAYGDLLLDLGRFEAAEDVYKNARQYDSGNRTGAHADLLFLEALKTANKNPSAGLKLFTELARKYPASSRVGDAVYVTAMIELEQFKNFERGLQLLEQYLKRNPKGRFAGIAGEQLKTIKNRR